MNIDIKLDLISKIRLAQTSLSLSNEEFNLLNEISNDLKVLEAIKINSKMPDVTSTLEGATLVVESTLYKRYTGPLSDGSYMVDTVNSGDFDRVLNYFMKFYKEKLNV